MIKNMSTSENKEMLCVRCPYSPINQIIRNGGEEICPDAYREIAKYCNLNNLGGGEQNEDY